MTCEGSVRKVEAVRKLCQVSAGYGQVRSVVAQAQYGGAGKTTQGDQ